MYRENVKMGVFLPPHHPNNEDPTLALQRDFELVEFLDRLGYHEAWIGEQLREQEAPGAAPSARIALLARSHPGAPSWSADRAPAARCGSDGGT